MVAEGIVSPSKSSVTTRCFDVEFWIEIASERDKRKIESDLRFKIDELAQTAGLTIAYPQRDVHLDAAGPLSVRILPPST